MRISGVARIQLDIIGKTNDLADLHTHFRLQLIAGNGRSAAHIGNGYIDAEIMQGFLKLLRCFTQMCIGISLRSAISRASEASAADTDMVSSPELLPG